MDALWSNLAANWLPTSLIGLVVLSFLYSPLTVWLDRQDWYKAISSGEQAVSEPAAPENRDEKLDASRSGHRFLESMHGYASTPLDNTDVRFAAVGKLCLVNKESTECSMDDSWSSYSWSAVCTADTGNCVTFELVKGGWFACVGVCVVDMNVEDAPQYEDAWTLWSDGSISHSARKIEQYHKGGWDDGVKIRLQFDRDANALRWWVDEKEQKPLEGIGARAKVTEAAEGEFTDPRSLPTVEVSENTEMRLCVGGYDETQWRIAGGVIAASHAQAKAA